MTTALMPTGTRSGMALPDLLDRLFGSTYTPSFGIDGAYRGLPTNVYEVGDTFQVAMLLPGADPDSIQVTALGNTMTVAGSMQLAQPEGGRFVWQEFLRARRSSGARSPCRLRSIRPRSRPGTRTAC